MGSSASVKFIARGRCSGSIGQGYEPMQLRLRTRRLEMGATAIGMTQRALDMTVEMPCSGLRSGWVYCGTGAGQLRLFAQ
jgi:hypothetical protein